MAGKSLLTLLSLQYTVTFPLIYHNITMPGLAWGNDRRVECLIFTDEYLIGYPGHGGYQDMYFVNTLSSLLSPPDDLDNLIRN